MLELKAQLLLASCWSRKIPTLGMMQQKVCISQVPNEQKQISGWHWLSKLYLDNLNLLPSLLLSGEYVDMIKAGIIDPLKVIRTALVDAARYFISL